MVPYENDTTKTDSNTYEKNISAIKRGIKTIAFYGVLTASTFFMSKCTYTSISKSIEITHDAFTEKYPVKEFEKLRMYSGFMEHVAKYELNYEAPTVDILGGGRERHDPDIVGAKKSLDDIIIRFENFNTDQAYYYQDKDWNSAMLVKLYSLQAEMDREATTRELHSRYGSREWYGALMDKCMKLADDFEGKSDRYLSEVPDEYQQAVLGYGPIIPVQLILTLLSASILGIGIGDNYDTWKKKKENERKSKEVKL